MCYADEEAEATRLAAVYTKIEQRVTASVEAYPSWPCRKGCDACCRRLARMPEMTVAEWQFLHQGFLSLPTARQEEVAAKIMTLDKEEAGATPFVTCPFLDEEHGECLVYAFRPSACRMYGFYVTRDGNQWCNDIQTLYDAGELDGIVLGNYTAIQHELVRCSGEVRSLVAWYRAEYESEMA